MNATRRPPVLITVVVCVGVLMVSGGAVAGSPPAQAASSVCPTSETALATDITRAGNGGTVKLSCRSRTTITFSNPISIGRSVIIDAHSSHGAIALEAYKHSGLFVVAEHRSLTVNSLTLSDGSAPRGGAIDAYSDTVIVTNCIFSNDSAVSGNGGAIYSMGGTLAVNSSSFLNDSARGDDGSGRGGAIYSDVGTLSVVRTTFFNNSASYESGAIDIERGALSIADSLFSKNSAGTFEGGAIGNEADEGTVTNSTFSNNSASGGGAFYNHLGTLLVENSTFTDNHGSYGGGAIYSDSHILTIDNSTFSNNSAVSGEGGAILNEASLAVANSTFSGNSAGYGGAIASYGGSVNPSEAHLHGD